jgi:uncharacterized protein YifE (UPF0438 family)
LKFTKYALSREQQKLLRKQGHKYYQLMDGTIPPSTQQQKHFVAVCKNLAEPVTEWERIWKSYWATIEEEKRLAAEYRENLRHSPKVREYLDRRWLGDSSVHQRTDPVSLVETTKDRSRECLVCHGSGMKADGDNCDRCNGRGWLSL